jgi:cell wall-associated NlpC family hydrolase
MSQFGITQVSCAPVRKEPSDSSEMVSQLLYGEDIEVIENYFPWIKISVVSDGYIGFIDAKQVKLLDETEYSNWKKESKKRIQANFITMNTSEGKKLLSKGSLLTETDERLFSISDSQNETSLENLAKDYLNTPYLWGGRSFFGIDCSGLTQVCCQILGISLSRDTSTQVKEGKEIEFEQRKTGDLAFFVNNSGKVIHVGILSSNNTILHASGYVREDNFDEKGIYRQDIQKYTHNYFTLRRVENK